VTLLILALLGVDALPFSLWKWSTPTAYARETIVILTSGTTWTVPSDWDDAETNTIEIIGGGAGGNQGTNGSMIPVVPQRR
jgi:hypothetical protein